VCVKPAAALKYEANQRDHGEWEADKQQPPTDGEGCEANRGEKT
jgi:hypothetical protein